jgi:hypothetical protein
MCVDANSVGAGERVDDDIKRLCMTLQRLEGKRDVLSRMSNGKTSRPSAAAVTCCTRLSTDYSR